MSAVPGNRRYPGRAKVPVGPTPAAHKAMFTAHRVDDALRGLAHAVERVEALAKIPGAADREYQSAHLTNHVSYCLDQVHELVANLKQNYPAEYRELMALRKTIGLAKAVDGACRTATTAHLTETVLHELTHAKRHTLEMLKTHPSRVWEFNRDHARKHVHGAHEHIAKLAGHLRDNYPEESRWLRMLDRLGGDGEQKKHGGYVRAAAPAAWPSGKAYRNSFLSPPARDEVVSAPGAGIPQKIAYGQLRQEPSQTISPSPPLPPSVSLPSPAELRAFGGALSQMADDADHHLRGAAMHLESAAEKMGNNPVSALACLRSAQMEIQECWRDRVMNDRPRIAYVFSANTPPAEQSSQRERWAAAQQRSGEMQAAAGTIAQFIDRVRRCYFGRAGMTDRTAGGGLSGFPTARM